jgi:uncharacterized membrane protein
MVFREGVETVLFLSALSLTTRGVAAWLGAATGIAAAVVFGVLFVRGSVRIDLARFFKITGATLLIFTVQLLVNGYHELSEAGWVPANATTMGVVGPLVRNEFFFVAAVVALPLLLILVPGREQREAPPAEGSGPEARLARAGRARRARLRWATGSLGAVVLALVGFGFVHGQPPPALSPATPVAVGADGTVRLPLAGLGTGELHRFLAVVDGRPVRFIALRLDETTVVTALDACRICGDRGYIQDGPTVVCLHCHSAIVLPTIGQEGGCNPIPLPSRVEGAVLVVAAADLAGPGAAAAHGGGHAGHG